MPHDKKRILIARMGKVQKCAFASGNDLLTRRNLNGVHQAATAHLADQVGKPRLQSPVDLAQITASLTDFAQKPTVVFQQCIQKDMGADCPQGVARKKRQLLKIKRVRNSLRTQQTGRNRHYTAAQCLAQNDDVGLSAGPLSGEDMTGSPKTGHLLIMNEQRAVGVT